MPSEDNVCRRHFQETHDLARQLDPTDVGNWFLHNGYFPEQYVLPPCLSSMALPLNAKPYFPLKPNKKGGKSLDPAITETVSISFPKTSLTQRSFAIFDPRHHHDLVRHVVDAWSAVLDVLFDDSRTIYSYTFPVPVDRETPGQVGTLRGGRMIYEFLEMAETDLVAESYRFKTVFRTDIANFYPSIYTHSIAWAMHGKNYIRQPGNRNDYSHLGNKLDKLSQYANDQCTNGIPVGPAISDLISEIVLSAVDLECSRRLKDEKIDHIGVRFKDDYRFLCNSPEQANRIASILQQSLARFNLALGDGKSGISKVPEGLFRPWTAEYYRYSLRRRWSINYRDFEQTLRAAIQIDQTCPRTGVIDRFLSELTSREHHLKLRLSGKQRRKAISLLLVLRRRRRRAFPTVLAIMEAMLDQYREDKELKKFARNSLTALLRGFGSTPDEHAYEILWIEYFLKAVLNSRAKYESNSNNPFVKSVETGSQEFFADYTDAPLFYRPGDRVPRKHLLEHLAVFARQTRGDDEGAKDGISE